MGQGGTVWRRHSVFTAPDSGSWCQECQDANMCHEDSLCYARSVCILMSIAGKLPKLRRCQHFVEFNNAKNNTRNIACWTHSPYFNLIAALPHLIITPFLMKKSLLTMGVQKPTCKRRATPSVTTCQPYVTRQPAKHSPPPPPHPSPRRRLSTTWPMFPRESYRLRVWENKKGGRESAPWIAKEPRDGAWAHIETGINHRRGEGADGSKGDMSAAAQRGIRTHGTIRPQERPRTAETERRHRRGWIKNRTTSP